MVERLTPKVLQLPWQIILHQANVLPVWPELWVVIQPPKQDMSIEKQFHSVLP